MTLQSMLGDVSALAFLRDKLAEKELRRKEREAKLARQSLRSRLLAQGKTVRWAKEDAA